MKEQPRRRKAANGAELRANNTRVCGFCKWVNHLFQAARSLPPLIVPSAVFDMRNYTFNNLCRAGDVCYQGIGIPRWLGVSTRPR